MILYNAAVVHTQINGWKDIFTNQKSVNAAYNGVFRPGRAGEQSVTEKERLTDLERQVVPPCDTMSRSATSEV